MNESITGNKKSFHERITGKSALAFLLLLSVAQAQSLKSNVAYADPARERQVLDIYAPTTRRTSPSSYANLGLPDDPATKELFKFLGPLTGAKR